MKTIRGICFGSSGSGKTSILNHLQYECYLIPATTSGVDYTSIIFDDVRLQIWDTSGDKRFRKVGMIFAKEVSVVIYVFDITSNRSLQLAIDYHQEITQLDAPQLYFMIGNKKDKNTRASNIIQTLKKYPNIVYYETDARSLSNLKEVFNDIVIKSSRLSSISRLTIERTGENDCCFIL